MDMRTANPYQPPASPNPAPAPQPTVPYAPEPTKRGVPKWVVAVGVLVALAVIGSGAFWFFVGRQQTSSTTPAPSAQAQNTTTPAPTPVTDATTAQYVSNGHDLNLNFSYPSSWSVTPPTNTNTDDKAITVTSPLVSMVDTAGKSITGRVIVSIRPGSTPMTELSGDKATAAQASTQIAYDHPTSAQHQYPFVSFIHLAGGSNPSSVFEEVIITGMATFTKDQPVLSTSLAQLDPIISARFYSCTATDCTSAHALPLSITNSTWLNNDTCKQALGIFQSLQIN